MKRYCIGKIYSQTEFRSEDAESFMDVNLDRLIEKQWAKLLEQNERFNSKFVTDILFSDEYKLDIWNEIYLKLLATSGKEEKLFLSISRIHIGEKVISNEDQNNCMKNTINNRKKKENVYNDDLIFSMDKIKSVRKEAKIDEFGLDIIRLWLSESEFRALFIDTEVRFDKYDPNSILNVINNKVQRDESYIVIEKILGLELGFYLQFCITEQIEEIEYTLLEKIIDNLIQLDGIHSRLLFLYELRTCLCISKYKEEKLECISSFLENLEQSVPLIQDIYMSVIKVIMEEYAKEYSYGTALKIATEKKEQYERLIYSKYFYLKNLVLQMLKRFFKNSVEKYNEKKLTLDVAEKLLQEIWNENNEVKENYVITNAKRNFENEIRWCDLKVDKYKNKIQARIIQESHKKYTKKAQEMS